MVKCPGVLDQRGGIACTMKRALQLTVSGLILLLGLFVAVRPGEAAQCFLASLYAAYVCDARPQPATFSSPEPRKGSILHQFTYSWIDDHAPIYAEPRPDAPVIGDAGVGFLYNTIQGVATDANGDTWFLMNGGWTPASYVHSVAGTPVTGVVINRQPERPFGWMLDTWVPRLSPNGPMQPEEERTFLQKYDFVEIYDAQMGSDGWVWYNIGDDQWVRDNYVAVVDASPRPAEVGANEFWVEVDLTEQVFVAYEGDRMIYSSLVASGLDRWPTRPGLFQVWDRQLSAPMSGGEVGDDFYNIQHVPYSMYFDDGISLHGAFWHNAFGHQKSHGCVNMPPRDAEWIYFWSAQAPNDLWVSVLKKAPDHILQNYGSELAAAKRLAAE